MHSSLPCIFALWALAHLCCSAEPLEAGANATVGTIASPADAQAPAHDEEEEDPATKAFRLFSLVVVDNDDDAQLFGQRSKDLVFNQGNATTQWRVPSDSADVSHVDPLFRHGVYADRITFDFFYAETAVYTISKPECHADNPNVASPKVSDFQLDEDEHSGTFSILYDCRKTADDSTVQNATLVVQIAVVGEHVARFAFRKTCGGGRHRYIEFGYYEDSENDAAEVSRKPFPHVRRARADDGGEGEGEGARLEPMVVGPHVSSTKVYMLLHPPAETQEFFHVSTRAEGKTVSVSAQGPLFGGVLDQGRAAVVYIFYECHDMGRVTISLTIPLAPFDDLRAQWTKDCGGGAAAGISIGSSATLPNDIVQRGVAHARWQQALRATSARVGEDAPVVNASTRVKDFWVTNDGVAMRTATEMVTVEKQDVVLAYATRSSATRGALYWSEGGSIIPSGGRQRLRLRMVCLKKGRSVVVVTMPIRSFNNIDFGFVKECRAPRHYQHSGFLRTAKSAMIAVSMLLTMTAITWWRMNGWAESRASAGK